MDQLRAMRVFARVVDEGGFAKAARGLDLAPPVVTRVVAELEEHLGSRLLHRTTRTVSLTEVGEAYLERVRTILAEVDEADAVAADATREVRGHLRVICPPAFAVHQLAKHLPRYAAACPQVSVEIAAPGPVETVDEAFDVSIILSRQPLQGDFVARRLARSEIVMCASPAYLDRRGRPTHPREMPEHDALIPPLADLQQGFTLSSGSFGDDEPPGETYVVQQTRRSRLATTHIDTTYAAALHGLGIAGLPSFVIEDALVEHELERVLPAWRFFDTHLWAAMPSRKHVPARTRAFIAFLVETFGGEDRDPWLAAAGCATPTARASASPRPPAGKR